MNQLSDYVVFVEDILTSEQCDQVIKWYDDNRKLEEYSKIEGVNQESTVDTETRSSKSIRVPLESEIDKILSSSVNSALMSYINTLNQTFKLKDGYQWTNFLPSDVLSEPYVINTYTDGGEYKWHTDQGYDYRKEKGLFSRQFSVVVYLNDNFEGGQTEFQFGLIEPKKGACLIFPSNFMYSHCSRPVTKGTKYACASWVAPLIREDV